MTPERTSLKRRVATNSTRTLSPHSTPSGRSGLGRDAVQTPAPLGRSGQQPEPAQPESGLFSGMAPNLDLWQSTRTRQLHKLTHLFTEKGAHLAGITATLSCAISDCQKKLATTTDPASRSCLEQQLTDLTQDLQALGKLKSSAYLISLRLLNQKEPGGEKALERLNLWNIGQLLDCLGEPGLTLDMLVLALREGVAPAQLIELHRAGLNVGAVRALRARCQQINPLYPTPTLEDIQQFSRSEPPPAVVFDLAVKAGLPLPELQAMVRAGLTASTMGSMPCPDDTSRAVQRMAPVGDGTGLQSPGGERLCLRDDQGALHHFLFVPCTPNGPVADQIRKGMALQRLGQHLGLDVMPDIHPHVHRSGGVPVYGMLIGCTDSQQTSTGATPKVDPREPAVLQQYLALEWMAYLCELDVRPEQLTWHHGPEGTRLLPTQPMGGLPGFASPGDTPLRFVGMGMPELIAADLAEALDTLTPSRLKAIAGNSLTHNETAWLCTQVERVKTALRGTHSAVQRLKQPQDWTTASTLETLGLNETGNRLQRLQDGTDTPAELEREAKGISLAAWHELACGIQQMQLQRPVPAPVQGEPATPRNTQGARSTRSTGPIPQHALTLSRSERSWKQRMEALEGKLDSCDVQRLVKLAAAYDASVASLPAARQGTLPQLADCWSTVQQHRLALLTGLRGLAAQPMPDAAARIVARRLRQLQQASARSDTGDSGPERKHHLRLAALGPEEGATAAENWAVVTTIAKDVEQRAMRALEPVASQPRSAWLDLSQIDTLDAWTRKLSSELAKLMAELSTQGKPVPEAITQLRAQTLQDLAGLGDARRLSVELNLLLPATQPHPLTMHDLLQLAALPQLGAPDIARALAAGCRAADIVQTHKTRRPLSLLLLASALVDPTARPTFPLADLTAELQDAIDQGTSPVALQLPETPLPSSPDRATERQRLDDGIDWNTDQLGDDEALKAVSLAATRYEERLDQLDITDRAQTAQWNDARDRASQSIGELARSLNQLASARPNQPAALLKIGRLQDQVGTEQAGLLRLGAFMDRLRHRLAPASLATLELKDLLPLAEQPELPPDYLVLGLQAGWTPHEVLQAHVHKLPDWTLPLASHHLALQEGSPGREDPPVHRSRLDLALLLQAARLDERLAIS
ncbi:MAG: hypothetical protein KGZ46_04555 [Hydrogenophaga sp.]|nr:hypothetical protein [Hydrogenophaga sp.]